MRQTVIGLSVAIAALGIAGEALACGYDGCAPLGYSSYNYNYSGFGGYSEPACGIGAPCTVAVTRWHYGHLPNPEPYYYGTWPRYYYVNQGPTYTGPGLLAPVPTYQERAVSGWTGYGPTAYGPDYRYSGGPYGNATTHYYDGMPAQTGPRIYTVQPAAMRGVPRHRPAPKPVPNPKINAGIPGHKVIQVD
jgi:hypothetical protein